MQKSDISSKWLKINCFSYYRCTTCYRERVRECERYKKLILFGEEKTFFRKNAYVRKKLCKSIKSPGNVEFRQRPVQIKAIQKNVLRLKFTDNVLRYSERQQKSRQGYNAKRNRSKRKYIILG